MVKKPQTKGKKKKQEQCFRILPIILTVFWGFFGVLYICIILETLVWLTSWFLLISCLSPKMFPWTLRETYPNPSWPSPYSKVFLQDWRNA